MAPSANTTPTKTKVRDIATLAGRRAETSYHWGIGGGAAIWHPGPRASIIGLVVATPMKPPSESVVDRFLRYVRINTESREGVAESPSTPGQWDLARLLARELQTLGVQDIHMSDVCMV